MFLLRWLAGLFGGIPWILRAVLAVLFVPIAFVLKLIGIPIMVVLSVLAVPVFLVLLVMGLPIFLVLAGGGAIMGLMFAVLSIGFAALKIFLFIVLPVLILMKILSWMFGWGRPRQEKPVDGTI